MVEVRGVEPLSEGMPNRFSPSAVEDLTFPPVYVPRRAYTFSSFILRASSQSFDGLVPHDHDAGNRIRGQFGPTRGIKPRKTIRYCQLLFFPVVARFRGRGSLTQTSKTPVETGTPPCFVVTRCPDAC